MAAQERGRRQAKAMPRKEARSSTGSRKRGAEAPGSCRPQVDERLSMLSVQQRRQKQGQAIVDTWQTIAQWPGDRTSHGPVPQPPHKDAEWPFGRWAMRIGVCSVGPAERPLSRRRCCMGLCSCPCSDDDQLRQLLAEPCSSAWRHLLGGQQVADLRLPHHTLEGRWHGCCPPQCQGRLGEAPGHSRSKTGAREENGTSKKGKGDSHCDPCPRCRLPLARGGRGAQPC